MSKKTNIVYFVADQMRCDSMHHMGNEASITPNLDSMLNDGVSFENAYCQNPVCVPSRCSFLTGTYPHTTGHRTMHFLQNADEPNILKTMKNNGYEVIWIGRNDVIPADRLKTEYCDEFYDGISFENQANVIGEGFGKHHKMPSGEIDTTVDGYYSFYTGKQDAEKAKETMDWKSVQSALDYLDRKKKSGNDKPFFLYVTITFPHPPYGCEDPWFSSIDRNNLNMRRPNIDTLNDKPQMLTGIYSKQNLQGWSEEKWNELRATYLAMVSRFDYHFGLIKNKLIENGFYDNSSIFVFSDHGDYTGDYGIVEKVQNCFENPISNVPLIIKPSNEFKCIPGKNKSLVELVDLSATIADMTDTEIEYKQFGKSLVKTLSGEENGKDAVFCEGGRVFGETWAMEKGHGPVSPYYPRLSTQCLENGAHTKATMIRMGNLKYTKRLYEKDELYDLDKDPLELNNVIDDVNYSNELLKLKERMLTYFMETGDWVPNRKDLR